MRESYYTKPLHIFLKKLLTAIIKLIIDCRIKSKYRMKHYVFEYFVSLQRINFTLCGEERKMESLKII